MRLSDAQLRFAQALCEAIGTDPDRTRNVTVHIPHNDVWTVTAEVRLTDDQIAALAPGHTEQDIWSDLRFVPVTDRNPDGGNPPVKIE